MYSNLKYGDIPVLKSKIVNSTKTKSSLKSTSKSFKAIRKYAEDYVRYMPVIVTGVRPNEIVIGIKTQAKDAVVKIHDKIIPPWKKELDHIRAYDDLWKKFLNILLNKLKYINGTFLQVLKYIIKNLIFNKLEIINFRRLNNERFSIRRMWRYGENGSCYSS